MLSYALPIGNGRLVLWTPAPRICWGELDGLGRTMTVLSPRGDLDVDRIAALSHDYIFRTTTRGTTKFNTFSRVKHMMLWGVIWLVGMDRPIEDVVGGIYLLFGLPMFMGLTEMILRWTYYQVFSKFKDQTYSPKVSVMFSSRLARLQVIYEDDGRTAALSKLDELGLGHLREFYRRAAWSERWEVGPPKGAGVIC